MDWPTDVYQMVLLQVILFLLACPLNSSWSQILQQRTRDSQLSVLPLEALIYNDNFKQPDIQISNSSPRNSILKNRDYSTDSGYVNFRIKRESKEGLLKSKYIRAKYVQSPYISSEKVKADRISSDKIVAKTVTVTRNNQNEDTELSSSRNRLKLKQFIHEAESGNPGQYTVKLRGESESNRIKKPIRTSDKSIDQPRLQCMSDLQNSLPVMEFVNPQQGRRRSEEKKAKVHFDTPSNLKRFKNNLQDTLPALEFEKSYIQSEGLQNRENSSFKINLGKSELKHFEINSQRSLLKPLLKRFKTDKHTIPPEMNFVKPNSRNGRWQERIDEIAFGKSDGQYKPSRSIYDLQASPVSSDFMEPHIRIQRRRPTKTKKTVGNFIAQSVIDPYRQFLRKPKKALKSVQFNARPVLAETEGAGVTRERIPIDLKSDPEYAEEHSGLLQVQKIKSRYIKAHHTKAVRIKADAISSKNLEAKYIITHNRDQEKHVRPILSEYTGSLPPKTLYSDKITHPKPFRTNKRHLISVNSLKHDRLSDIMGAPKSETSTKSLNLLHTRNG